MSAQSEGLTEMSDVNARIDEIVKNNDIVLFMKGNPGAPACGFSSKAVGALEAAGAPVPASVEEWAAMAAACRRPVTAARAPTAVPDPTDIFNAISLAWMTDRLIPTVTNTVRKSTTSCRADQRFMTSQCSH